MLFVTTWKLDSPLSHYVTTCSLPTKNSRSLFR